MSSLADHDGEEMDLCEKCHTDHEGFEADTLGAKTRCIRAQAQAITVGGDRIIDKLASFEREQQQRREDAMRKAEFDV